RGSGAGSAGRTGEGLRGAGAVGLRRGQPHAAAGDSPAQAVQEEPVQHARSGHQAPHLHAAAHRHRAVRLMGRGSRPAVRPSGRAGSRLSRATGRDRRRAAVPIFCQQRLFPAETAAVVLRCTRFARAGGWWRVCEASVRMALLLRLRCRGSVGSKGCVPAAFPARREGTSSDSQQESTTLMARPIDSIRNVALVGHGAVGKTTLADLMLHKAGVNSRAGSVDEGSSLLDTDDDEKERKHSITSALVHVEHAGKRINLIDAPGMPDFLGQAVGALRAVETAVVTVSAAAGIEVNTRKTFQLAGKAGCARMIVINKCGADNIRFEELLENLRELFGPACALMNVPIGLGSNFSGVCNTVELPVCIPYGCVVALPP